MFTAPASSPTEFLAELNANLTVHLSWVPPPQHDINGNLLGYKLNCSDLSGHEMSLTITGLSATFYNVHNNTHYCCTICAYTSVGCGPFTITHYSTYGKCKYFVI